MCAGKSTRQTQKIDATGTCSRLAARTLPVAGEAEETEASAAELAFRAATELSDAGGGAPHPHYHRCFVHDMSASARAGGGGGGQLIIPTRSNRNRKSADPLTSQTIQQRPPIFLAVVAGQASGSAWRVYRRGVRDDTTQGTAIRRSGLVSCRRHHSSTAGIFSRVCRQDPDAREMARRYARCSCEQLRTIFGGQSCASATASQAQPGTAWRQCTPSTTPSDGLPSALPVADLCCKSCTRMLRGPCQELGPALLSLPCATSVISSAITGVFSFG